MESASPERCLTASELVDFIDGGPSGSRCAEAVAHLGICPQCRQIVLEMRSIDVVAVPTRSFAWQEAKWLPRWRPLAVLGAIAALAFGSAIVLTKLRPPVPPTTGVENVSHAVASLPQSRTQPPSSVENSVTRPVSGIPPRARPFVPARPGPTGPHPNDVDDASLPPTDQQYCLVGADGVFVMPSADYRLEDRKKIEETYADRVKAAHDAAAKRAEDLAATSDLNRKLKAAAEEREKALSAIYTRRDVVPDRALALKIDADAPYQVVELDYQRNRSLRPTVRVVVHPPWPGYAAARSPYGWDYGVAYEPSEFRSRYVEWRRHYVAEGRPAFYGLVGRDGPVRVDDVVGSRSAGYAYRHGVVATPTEAPAVSGYTHSPVTGAPSSGYTHVETPVTRPQGYTHAANGFGTNGGYAHAPTAEATKPGYAHGEAAGAETGSASAKGYSHSAQGSRASNGYTHSRAQSKPSGYRHSDDPAKGVPE